MQQSELQVRFKFSLPIYMLKTRGRSLLIFFIEAQTDIEAAVALAAGAEVSDVECVLLDSAKRVLNGRSLGLEWHTELVVQTTIRTELCSIPGRFQ